MLFAIPKSRFYYSAAVLLSLASANALAGKTTRASVNALGVQANGQSVYAPSISADGSVLAFMSAASNLVSGDTNNTTDVFVTDLLAHKVTRVSVGLNGVQGNGPSWVPKLSANGRYVVFSSDASNLVAQDTNGNTDVFVYDRSTRQTTRVSVASVGGQGNDNSGGNSSSISADGRYVAFDSDASNLVSGDSNAATDIFVYDRVLKQTTRASVATSKVQGNSNSGFNSTDISSDGRFVAFDSDASNLVAGDTNNSADVFVYDRSSKQTTRVSIATNGAQGAAWSLQPSLNADGRYVTFESAAANLVAGDSNDNSDVFVYDRQNKQTSRVSQLPNGVQGNAESFDSSFSIDGRYVVFRSYASNLVALDNNGKADIFMYDRVGKQMSRASVDSAGRQSGADSWEPSVSANGRYVAFASDAANLVAGDSNNQADIFVWDRLLDSSHSADLKIVTLQKPISLKVNSLGTYNFTISNNGPGTVANLSLVQVISGGSVVRFKPSQGTCGIVGLESLCNFGPLSSGKSLTLQLVAKASTTPLIQQITVSGEPVDATPATNVLYLSTPVQP
jgi:Tol biopolymer transport system component